MPVIKCKSHIEVYQARAVSSDLHELSGRGGNKTLTEFIAKEILKALNLSESISLIDVGCGDGTLLRLAAPTIGDGLGVLPNNEEVTKVKKALSDFSNLSISLGYSHTIPAENAVADCVVCNGVFILLDESQISQSLAEISRVSKPGALVFIGELPKIDEMADRTYGDSIFKWLIWVYKQNGFLAFFNAASKFLKVIVSNEKFIISPKNIFYTNPEIFIENAKQYSLKIIRYWDHIEINEKEMPVPSKTRIDFLFQKEV